MTKGNFILLLSVLLILTVSWKKEGKVSVATPAKTVKRDSTILLAALKMASVNTIPLNNTAPSEIMPPEGQIRARAQLQVYMDSLIISPAATISLKRDAKTVIDNDTVNEKGPHKNVTVNKFVTGNATTKIPLLYPADIPPDPDH